MQITPISFENFYKLPATVNNGIVLLGAGGDAIDWILGVTAILNDEKIANGDAKKLWGKECFILTTTGGRTDIAMIFATDFDLNRMAIWRIKFGDCLWVSDYYRIYAAQHGVGLELSQKEDRLRF